MALGKNIKLLRERLGLSQYELSEKTNGEISQGAISALEKRDSKSSEFTATLAKALNVSIAELLNGGQHAAKQNLQNYEVSPIDARLNTVPLISWVQAGAFTEAIEDLANAERIATDAKIKPRTYALRVTGDSMLPLFPPGMILIVDPEMAAIHGDYVIAKNGDNEATFKQLIKDGADWYLKPLNPQYPIKSTANIDIIGVVVQAQSVTKFK